MMLWGCGVHALLALLFTQHIAAQNQTTSLSTSFGLGLRTALGTAGLDRFSEAFRAATSDGPGAALLATLSSGQAFTIYAPINEAWNDQGHALKVISYHISPSIITKSDVAPPRQHTIAYTELRQDQVLPGSQTQVLVLETAPGNNSQTLLRGADWNATTTGNTIIYENIRIQPIDRTLTPPLLLFDTLRLPLDSSAVNGTASLLKLVEQLGTQDSLAGCKGCTFFIPNDASLASFNLTGLNGAQQANILLHHVITGDVRYSPELNAGDTWTSAAGQTIAYVVNATGAFITNGALVAKIVRSDIPVTNGIVHLVNRVIGSPNAIPDRAAAVWSAASAAAATQTTANGVLGRITSSSPATQTSTARPVTSSRSSGHRRVILRLWPGV